MTPKSLADPALLPSATAIVRCVREAVDSVLAPALQGLSERSTVATIQPTLRYVEQLIDHQGQILLDEQRMLAGLLPEAARWLTGQPGKEGAGAAIEATLAREEDPTIYPSLAIMGDRVAQLREHVCTLLTVLHGRDPDDAVAESLHARLRDYIAWQIEQEGRLVEPAFLGRGARR